MNGNTGWFVDDDHLIVFVYDVNGSPSDWWFVAM
jgi:hypothetical protein